MVYPEQFIETCLISKDGKAYERKAYYKLSHYTYEELKNEKIELPPKLSDIKRETNN